MIVNRKNIKPYANLVLYSKRFDSICQIKGNSFKTHSNVVFYSPDYEPGKIYNILICNLNNEIFDDFIIFGEPDFPMEKLPDELKVTELEEKCLYFFKSK